MKLTSVVLQENSLASRVVRNLVGERVINLAEDIGAAGEEGGILTSIFGLGKKIIGFIVSTVVGLVVWSLSDLWDIAVEAYFELKYFDWNQTDAELKSSLAANDALLAGAFGRLAGTGLVWLAGIGVSSVLSFKYPVLAGRVALELAEEGGTEIRSALINLITVARQNAVRSALLGGLLTARRLEQFGLKPVTEELKPWSIAEGIDNLVSSLPSSAMRSFADNFIDSVEDSIIEMGYVISYTLDDFYLSQKLANQSTLGQERTIELTPDIRVEEERIIIESPQELAINTTQTVMAQHQLVHNRDMGQIVGIPEIDYRTPDPQRRKLKIIFRGKRTPPWKLTDNSTAMTAEVSISDAKQGLTWQQIKSVVKSYTWGKYRVTAHLSNGRQMKCHAVSYAEGQRQLNEYIKLSTATITRFNLGVTENDSANLDKRIVPTVVYPAYAKLTVGDVRLDGSLRSKKKSTVRVDLWVQDEPDNSDQLK